MTDEILYLTTTIVTGYVNHNSVPVTDLQRLILDTYQTLGHIGSNGNGNGNGKAPEAAPEVEVEPSVEPEATPEEEPAEEVSEEPVEATAEEPAVPVRKSVFHDYIVCLCCGKHQKVLRGHLSSRHQLTPEQYRNKWGLPSDYPIVAPSYSEKRQALAVQIGLGRGRHSRR